MIMDDYTMQLMFVENYRSYTVWVQQKIGREDYKGNNAKECCEEMIGLCVKRLADYHYPISSNPFTTELQRVLKLSKQYRNERNFYEGLAKIGIKMCLIADKFYQKNQQ